MNMNLFNGMFGKIEPGCCRLSMNGNIAVKTSNGYKTYNVKTGKLTNCSNFVFDIGEDFFFVIPTNKVSIGDIILVGGKPHCVIEAGKNSIKTFRYEDSTIETIVPERHVFMGNTYFYGKIISLFGNGVKSKGGMSKMMKYAMMSQMFGGNNGNMFSGMSSGASNGNSMNPMMMMLMMNGGMEDLFDFDFGMDESDEDTEADEEMEDFE